MQILSTGNCALSLLGSSTKIIWNNMEHYLHFNWLIDSGSNLLYTAIAKNETKQQ
jgi:hypothetical protein